MLSLQDLLNKCGDKEILETLLLAVSKHVENLS